MAIVIVTELMDDVLHELYESGDLSDLKKVLNIDGLYYCGTATLRVQRLAIPFPTDVEKGIIGISFDKDLVTMTHKGRVARFKNNEGRLISTALQRRIFGSLEIR